jgi:DNA helicase HerA-like ATPase
MLNNYDAEIAHELSNLKRNYLDNQHAIPIQCNKLLDGYEMCKIVALANFWKDQPDISWAQRIKDLIVGTWSFEKQYITLVVVGTPLNISVYISLGKLQHTKQILQGILPGIKFDPSLVSDLGTKIKEHFRHTSLIRGIPDGKENNEISSCFPLERITRGMRGATWVYMIQAFPRSRTEIFTAHQQVLQKLSRFSSVSRASIQRTTQQGRQINIRSSESSTDTFSGEIVNWSAEYLLELLQVEKLRLEQGIRLGQWQVSTTLGASTPENLERLSSLAVGVFGGENSRPEPIQNHLCYPSGKAVHEFHTYLTSNELAVLFQPLREEHFGYAIHDYVEYDVDFDLSINKPVILGEIIQDGVPSKHEFGIPLNDLAKHGVVVGVTGSGKTTSVMKLLYSVYQSGIPFCVIEPAKTEYRALLGNIVKGKATGLIPNLRVYSLGNETIAPFRLNPFEFETNEEQGSVSVLSHIDHLKAVFNAAFILYAPMPYILETALHEIYEDKGWNLATGVNERIPANFWVNRHQYPLFPTLSDLYRKIDNVVARLGYDKRITQDVQAGLKARIGALRLGSKGLMLDTAHSIPISELLENPTILELENIGNDDEKTFVMGLLLLRLYEYRRLQAASGKLSSDLQHILVIEEAHRLLANVSTQVSTETANPRAQAVETFVNMLSEIRAYRQGVLVAEQIPTKLTPDVIKNTNLKIVHRMLALDDRQLLGTTMNMNEAQIQHISVLSPGIAVVYAEGVDHPYMLQIKNVRSQQQKQEFLTDNSLCEYSKNYINLESTLYIPDLFRYISQRTVFGSPEALPYQSAGKLIEHFGDVMWAKLLLCLMFNSAKLPEALNAIRQYVNTNLSYLQPDQREITFHLFLIRISSEGLYERATENGWLYNWVEEMRKSLTLGIINYLKTSNLKNTDLNNFVRLYGDYLNREYGSFAGCVNCGEICLYKQEVSRLISSADVEEIRKIDANPQHKAKTQRYSAISEALKEIAEKWLMSPNISGTRDIAYCAGLHIAPLLGLSEIEQAEFGNDVAAYL